MARTLRVSVVDGAELIGHEPFDELESMQVGVFSAATFTIDDRSIVVTNPTASEARRRSDIAHELAHIILKHELSEILEVSGVPFRSCRTDQEEEANALAGTLLLPRSLLTRFVYRDRGSLTPDAVAARFGVSVEMARFRINTTGVARQVQRSRV